MFNGYTFVKDVVDADGNVFANVVPQVVYSEQKVGNSTEYKIIAVIVTLDCANFADYEELAGRLAAVEVPMADSTAEPEPMPQ